MLSKSKDFLNCLIDILYRKYCLLCATVIHCDSKQGLICLNCWEKIERNVPPVCSYCGAHLNDKLTDNICNKCKQKRYYFDRAYAVCSYEGKIKELIHQFKYKGKDYLGAILGELMVESISQYAIPIEIFDWVIPVPLHTRKMREREFNQSSILAEYLSNKLNLPFLKKGLLRIKDTEAQAQLPRDKRIRNVINCFKANPQADFKGKNVLLVDDLLTTGATCSEAAIILKNAGCDKVFVLTLAN